MRATRALVVVAALLVCASCSLLDETQSGFLKYIKDFKKNYASNDEFDHKYENYKASLLRIKQLNSQNGAKFAINKFSDMSVEEFSETVLMKNKKYVVPLESLSSSAPDVDVSELPTTLDWRTKNAVTPVKDQGQCGSCWAFSATEAIESAWLLAGHATPSTLALAPQQIVDCDKVDKGCDGGDTGPAYKYVIKAGGLDSEASYPYKAKDGKCAFQNSTVVARITGYKEATTAHSESVMQQNLVNWGPLSICVDAAHWQDYKSGVMTKDQCAFINRIDHCVQLVGYDSSVTPPYWIVRNSWNTDWGVEGYIHLQMDTNTCGLTSEPTWPTV